MRRGWRPGRQSPAVKNGKVRKKNRWDTYVKSYPEWDGRGEIPIVYEPARRGATHVVDEANLRRFIPLIPNWRQLAEGLHCLVLGDGDDEYYYGHTDCFGWQEEGVVCLEAWELPIEQTWDLAIFERDRVIIERLMVDFEIDGEQVRIDFDRRTARGFMLMGVLLHELGHHYDRMRTKKQRACPGGEAYADDFAENLAERMWPAFFRERGF
jgi:hypothetical protein